MTSPKTAPLNLAFNPPPPRWPLSDKRSVYSYLNHAPLKQGWDALALAQIVLRRSYTAKQKLQCLRFYLNQNGMGNIYTSLSRSGNAWSILGLSLAYDLSRGGNGNFDYVDELWVPENGLKYTKVDWREAVGNRTYIGPVGIPIFHHSHHPYFRIRSARLKEAKIVILVRNIFSSIESNFFKLAKDQENPDSDDDSSFNWNDYIDQAVEFYNSWGEVINWHPNCLVFKYEDLLKNPVAAHKEMADHWELGIPLECVEQAFAKITKEKMKEVLDRKKVDSRRRVSFRNRKKSTPKFRIEQIQENLDSRLNYTFGYDYF